MKKISVLSIIGMMLLSGILFVQNINNKANAYSYYGVHDVTSVRASHILVESKEEATKLKLEIENGNITFEEAAKKYSKCPSGENGGDLGYFTRGQMVKSFEDVAFSMPLNKISEPVRTQFGWHLIKVTSQR